MKRIDRIISEQTNYSRKEIKSLISKKKITVDDTIVKKPEEKYDESKVIIKIDGNELVIKDHIYLILNKPEGYVSATEDENDKTVLELVPEKFNKKNIFPVGRLDKDTTGLLILTDDGEFSHNILAPNKHVKKAYEVELDIEVTKEMVDGFKSGVKLNDGICKEASLEITGEKTAIVTITEGRYHQIKRMFGCFGAKVVKLNRIMVGSLYLPKDLKLGEVREASKEELDKIMKVD